MVVNDIEKKKIYIDYYEKVFGYIINKVNNRQTAEDLAGDVFVKVYSKLDTFDDSKSSVSTWIYNITRNTLIDYYRTRKTSDEIPEELASDGDTPEDTAVNNDMLEKLADALEKLDERSRKIIILKYYTGLNMKEIAAKLGISYSYARIIEEKALDTLKDSF